MNPMEELLTMFDPRFNAPGIEDPRRRMSKMGQSQGQGGGGIAGPEATLGRLLPFLLGLRQQNFTGFNTQIPGGGMAQPAMDLATPIAGVNVAPGTSDGRSINPGLANPQGTTLSGTSNYDNRTIQNAGYGDISRYINPGGSAGKQTGPATYHVKGQTGGGGGGARRPVQGRR